MTQESTNPSLLLRVRDPADAAAWREFESIYGEVILRYCRARQLQQSDAEDVRQIALTNLVRAMRGFEYSPERGRFRSYVGRVVRNAISRHARRSGSDVPIDGSVMDVMAGETDSKVDALWEREWIRHHYRLAMQEVRRTFDGRSVEVFDGLVAGRSVAQLADEFGLTPDAVYKIKYRIRDRLRALIADQVAEEEDPDGYANPG